MLLNAPNQYVSNAVNVLYVGKNLQIDRDIVNNGPVSRGCIIYSCIKSVLCIYSYSFPYVNRQTENLY